MTADLIQPNGNGKFPTPLDGALFMASLGLPQTPLRPRTKDAFLSGFQHTATTDPAQIHKWAEMYPNCNFGSVGREGEFFTFEADSPKVRKRFEETGGQFGSKLMVMSGPGRGHRWYKYVPGVTNIQQAFTKHGDFSVRAKNMYCVSPGSIHPDTGEQYRLVATGSPEIPSAAEIAFWESERAEKKDGKQEAPRNEKGLVPHGSIHGYLLTQAGKLRALGLDEDSIRVALHELVEKNCEPPIDWDKVDQMAKSICNFPAGEDKSLVLNQGATTQAAAPAEITPELLLKEFPAYDGTEPDGLPMLIEGFMPEGVGFFGSLAGTIKTWAGLSIVKALTNAAPLWDVFPVKEKVAVLYLIPEASDASFKRRMKKMGITQDKTLFRYRTISQGRTRYLTDELTLAVIKELSSGGRKVLVIVDTAVRFFRGGDENASMENSLVNDSDTLRSLGVSVLFQHHSPKATKDAADLTLENVLRGTGDFGAMADYVYGFRRDETLYAHGDGPEEVEVVNVKPRDFEPPLPFRLQLKRRAKMGEDGPTVSVIDEIGDLKYVGNSTLKEGQAKMLAVAFKEDPYISFNSLSKLLKMKRELIKDFCKAHGWKQVAVTVPGAKGGLVKKFRWTHGLLMGGQVDEIDAAASLSEANQPGDTVQLEDITPLVAQAAAEQEPVAQGF
jgi:hypothetical protein